MRSNKSFTLRKILGLLDSDDSQPGGGVTLDTYIANFTLTNPAASTSWYAIDFADSAQFPIVNEPIPTLADVNATAESIMLDAGGVSGYEFESVVVAHLGGSNYRFTITTYSNKIAPISIMFSPDFALSNFVKQ